MLLAAVEAGRLPLARAVAALTTGPAAVLAGRTRRTDSVGLVEGARADLVVFDRADRWIVTADALASRGKNTPLVGMELGGRVLITVADGRIALRGSVSLTARGRRRRG